MNKIIWFRYDLRLIDNDAFSHAVKQGNTLPIFIFDKDYFKLDTSSSFHLYPIRIKSIKSKLNRNYLYQKLKEINVGVNIHYIPIYRHSYYKKMGFKILYFNKFAAHN